MTNKQLPDLDLSKIKKALIDKIYEILEQTTCPIRFQRECDAIDDIERTATWKELRNVAGIDQGAPDKRLLEAIQDYPIDPGHDL